MKVGIIGCGIIGSRRASVILQSRDDKVVMVADIDESRAKNLAAEIGCVATRDWQEVMDRNDIDTVIISTTNNWLAPISISALKRGKHVLCEKPLGRNVRESAEIRAAAQGNGVVLKTGFNHRHHPAIQKAHRLVEVGTIGKPYYVKCTYGHGGRPGYEKEWRASKDICGGGELLDQGVHVVDLFRWFLGDFEETFGYIPTCYWDMEVEDNAFALFRTAKGQIGSMHTSWTQWKNRFTFEVCGEAGYIIVDGLGGSYGTETLRIGKRKIQSEDRKSENEKRESTVFGFRFDYLGGAPNEEVIEFPGPDISWEEEWKEFLSAIKENRAPLGNGQDGLEANRMIEAVYRSARENRPVKIGDE